MKDIFNNQTITELKTRINQLNADATPAWGKMNVFQMLKHCTENERMMVKEKTLKRRFFGRIFGKMVLYNINKDDAPLAKNTPTHPTLIITGDGNIAQQKQLWIATLEKYPTMQPTDFAGFVHPFFGKMDSTQIGRLAYKHVDHHLRQFGV